MHKLKFGTVTIFALLAACGGGTGDDAASETRGVEVAGIGTGSAQPPANLPPFAPVYPGAKVTTTTLAAQEPDKGIMTLAVPSADLAAILAFYKQKGESDGLTAAMETVTGEARVMAMSDGNGEDARALQVTAAPDGEGGAVVTIVYSGGSGTR